MNNAMNKIKRTLKEIGECPEIGIPIGWILFAVIMKIYGG